MSSNQSNDEVEAFTLCLSCHESIESDEEIYACDEDTCNKRFHEQCAANIWMGSEFSLLSTDICLREFGERNSKEKERRIMCSYPFLCPSCDLLGTSKFLMMYFLVIEKQKKTSFINRSYDTTYLTFLVNLFHERNLLLDTSKEFSSTLIDDKSELKELIESRPETLIGKPVVLFCPLDGIMHNGRIIDKKGEENEIEFLVRFPPGRDGRISAFHQWINIEEHMILLGTSVVWVEHDSANGCLQWPAQKILFSRVEKILNKPRKPCPPNFIRVVSFGHQGLDMLAISSDKSKLFPSPIFERENDALKCDNPKLNEAVIAASMEFEEQNRVISWKRAFLDDPSSSSWFSSSMNKYQKVKSKVQRSDLNFF